MKVVHARLSPVTKKIYQYDISYLVFTLPNPKDRWTSDSQTNRLIQTDKNRRKSHRKRFCDYNNETSGLVEGRGGGCAGGKEGVTKRGGLTT